VDGTTTTDAATTGGHAGRAGSTRLENWRSPVLSDAEQMLVDVYSQVGNHRPAERRHALTPGVRDRIRDYLRTLPVSPCPRCGRTVRGQGAAFFGVACSYGDACCTALAMT
jgi:hypothetical protein